MAFFKFENLRVAGIATCVPEHVEPTISTSTAYNREAYMATTGILEKRWSNDFTASDLCQAATERLLESLGWERDSIDVLIFVSQTPDYILPATACVLHGKLGLKKACLCQDISLGCSGWVYGMTTALSLLQAGTSLRRALVLSGDARKSAYEEPDQLFGYAGTATAVEYDPERSQYPIFIEVGTDGTGYDAIIRPEGGTRNPINEKTFELVECEDGRKRHGLQTRMKGMDVFAFGITTAPKSIKKLAKEAGFEYVDFDYFVFHQANRKMNETIRAKLKLPEEKVPYSMTHFGNTSSASIPLTITTELGKTLPDKKVRVIGCGFGVGLSWGTIAFEADHIVIPPLVEL